MIAGLLHGLLGYFRAFGFISRYGLMSYFLYSGLIGVILFGGVFYGVKSFGPWLSDAVVSLLPVSIDINIKVVKVLSYVLSSALFLSVLKYVIIICMAPLMSQLSEKVERIKTGVHVSRPIVIHFIPDLLRSLRINIRNVIKELLITALLMALGWIPIFAVPSVVLIFLLQAYYAGFGNVDYFTERHMTYSQTIKYVRDHRARTMGNGIGYIVLLAIPVIGVCLAPPLATVSATLDGVDSWEE